MAGYDNALPPGLRGYMAGQFANQRTDANNLGMLTGILQLQQGMEAQQFNREMKPLQLQQLQIAVQQAQQLQKFKQGILSEMNAPQLGAAQGALTAEAAAGGAPGPTNAAAARIPQQQGASGGIPNSVRFGLLSGDPGLMADAKAWLDQNKPISTREGGGIYDPGSRSWLLPPQPKTEAGIGYNPTTGTANVVPGYAPAVSTLSGATEAPKLREFKIGGRDFTMSNADYTTLMGSDQLAAVQVANRYGIPYNGGPGNAAPQPSPQPMPGPRPAPAGPTLAPPLAPTLPGQPIPSGRVLQNPTASEAAAATAVASGRAKSGVEFEDMVLAGGRQGRSNLTQLQLIAPDLEKLPTGPAYNAIVNAKSYLSQFGLSADPNLGPAQATRALLNQMALKIRNPAGGEGMPGAMSDPDREFLVASINGLDKLPDANRRLMDIFMTLEQRKIAESQIVSNMRQKGMGSEDIRNALHQYADRNPIRNMLKYGR